jgi:Flp pilus assembly pilin Flp
MDGEEATLCGAFSNGKDGVMRNIVRALGRLHRCEQGAEALELVLIVAAIALPLLGVLIFFRQRLVELVGEAWKVMTGNGNPVDPGQPPLP